MTGSATSPAVGHRVRPVARGELGAGGGAAEVGEDVRGEVAGGPAGRACGGCRAAPVDRGPRRRLEERFRAGVGEAAPADSRGLLQAAEELRRPATLRPVRRGGTPASPAGPGGGRGGAFRGGSRAGRRRPPPARTRGPCRRPGRPLRGAPDAGCRSRGPGSAPATRAARPGPSGPGGRCGRSGGGPTRERHLPGRAAGRRGGVPVAIRRAPPDTGRPPAAAATASAMAAARGCCRSGTGAGSVPPTVGPAAAGAVPECVRSRRQGRRRELVTVRTPAKFLNGLNSPCPGGRRAAGGGGRRPVRAWRTRPSSGGAHCRYPRRGRAGRSRLRRRRPRRSVRAP